MYNKHSFTLPENVRFSSDMSHAFKSAQVAGEGQQFSQSDYQNAYVSTFLTDQLKAYTNAKANYVWDKIFPTRPVIKPKGKLTSLGFQSLRLQSTLRSARGGANKIEFGVANVDEYSVEQHALYADVMAWDIENADAPMDAKRDYTFLLKGIMDLSKEHSAVSQAFSSTVMSGYTTALSGTARFDYVGTDSVNPLKTIQTYFAQVKSQCTQEPTDMFISYDVGSALVYNADILNAFKFTTVPLFNIAKMEEILSAAFKVNVHIVSSQSRQNGSTNDIDAGTLSYLVSKSILLTYNGGLGLYTNGFGYTFTRKGGQKVLTIDYPPSTQVKDNTISMVAAVDEYDMVIQDAKCGYLLTSVIS